MSKFRPFRLSDCVRQAARFLLKSVNAQRSVARCALLSTLCATGETRAASRHHGAARAAPMLGHGRAREPGAALFPDAAGARAPARGPEASEKTPFLVRDANDRGEPGRASARGRVTSDARRHLPSGLPSRASPRDARERHTTPLTSRPFSCLVVPVARLPAARTNHHRRRHPPDARAPPQHERRLSVCLYSKNRNTPQRETDAEVPRLETPRRDVRR